MLAFTLGVVLLALKFFGIDPVAQWSWWWVLSPFAVAVIWWALADFLGITAAGEMRKMQRRKLDRLNEQRKSMGLPPRQR